MTWLRRIAFPSGLALARLARRSGRVVVVTLGIAAGAALLAAVLGGSLVMQNRSLERTTERLPANDRTVRLTWGGIGSGPTNDLAALDRTARKGLRPLAARPTRAMLFRQSQAGGRLFDLGAIDGLARFVRVRRGHLPKMCRPDRCEVLQLGGTGPMPKLPGLRLVRVGTATLDSEIPFGNLITRETYASVLSSALRYHTASTPPLLLANGVAGLASARVFAPTYRSYTWTAPLQPEDVHPWTIDSFARSVTRARSELQSQSLAFDLTAPIAELEAGREAGRVAGRRLLLIGGEAAALLLAFAVLAATGLRRDAEAQWRRLTWYGARRWQLVLGSATEAGVVAVLGAGLGWLVGSAVSAIVADRAGVPIGALLRHSVAEGQGFVFAAAVAATATVVILLSLRAGSARLGALTVTPVDAAAVGAAVAVVVALARGEADAGSLAAERGTATVLLLLPALIAFVAAVLFARVLAPMLRLLERWGRAGPLALRLAALSLARNPGRAAVAAAFLVVSLGLAFFAATYRATLARGQHDQAAFTVPVDAIAREDLTKLVPVLAAAPLDRFESLLPGVRAVPVIRLSGNVRRLETSHGFTLLALPAAAVPSLSWRDDYAPLARDDLARRLRPTGSVALRGARLPPDGRRLQWPISARGDELAVRAVVVTDEGVARGIALGTTLSPRLGAAIPPEVRGGLLVSLTFDLTGTGLHGVPNGGLNAAAVAQGTMTIGRPRIDGRALPLHFDDWTGKGGISPEGPQLRYLVTGDNVARFRARQPTDDRPTPVAVSPELADAAGPGGVLPLAVGSGTITGRVVATVRRVPTIEGDAVLADGPTVATALNADSPGVGAANEVWLKASRQSDRRLELELALRRPPFDVLQIASRRAVQADLRSEPLARGTLITLTGAALVALALALVGLLLGLLSDLRDERGELFDLEAQGASPALLQRHLRLRSALVAAFGVVGGLATGAVLTLLIVSLVTLTAGAGSAEPPLLLSFDWLTLLLGVAAYAIATAFLIVVATRHGFRSEVAGRFAEVGT